MPNDRTAVRQIIHADPFNTPFLEIRFPAAWAAELGGTPVGQDDSVTVVVQPEFGTYGFTLSPSGLVFNTSALPTVRFFYGMYGDLSVSAGSYDSEADYAAALAIWHEVTPGQWETVPTDPDGLDVIRAAIGEPGTYIVAARR